MSSSLVLLRRGAGAFAIALGVIATIPGRAEPALAPNPGPFGAACEAWELEYALNANLKLTDTPLGQGDGIYKIGPGRVTLRFDDSNGRPGGAVQMISYAMRDHFTVKSRTLFWSTVVETDTKTRATPDKCGVAAKGVLSGNKVAWTTKVNGYRVDGTVTCTGALCGKFGAPPAGTTQLHIGPSPVQFNPFELSTDLKKLHMAYTFVTKTSVPKQTSYVELAGAEVRRACVSAPVCK